MRAIFKTRIVIDPKIMAGKPVIKGTRVPVEAIIKRLAEGMSVRDILKDYPNITKEDVSAALQYAAKVIEGEDIIPFAEVESDEVSG